MNNRWGLEDVEKIMAQNPDLGLDDRASKVKASGVNSLYMKNEDAPTLCKKHKYNVSPKEARIYRGILYASKKEAKYAEELDLRKKAGEISFWLRQVPFDLPGHSRYFVDFITFQFPFASHGWATVVGGVISKVNKSELPQSATIEFVEIKGRDLSMGKLKRRQCEELYGIKIKVV